MSTLQSTRRPLHRPGRGVVTSGRPTKRQHDPEWGSLADAYQRQQPVPIDDAEWQTGVTPGHGNFRIFLNGEPVVGAIAANERIGWVDVVRVTDNPARWEAFDLLDQLMGNDRKRLTGYVQIVRDKYC